MFIFLLPGKGRFFLKKNKKLLCKWNKATFSEKVFFGYAFQAITEISTFTFLGNVFTATHSRAG